MLGKDQPILVRAVPYILVTTDHATSIVRKPQVVCIPADVENLKKIFVAMDVWVPSPGTGFERTLH